MRQPTRTCVSAMRSHCAALCGGCAGAKTKLTGRQPLGESSLWPGLRARNVCLHHGQAGLVRARRRGAGAVYLQRTVRGDDAACD
jgi:hypothetical protein